MLNVLDRACISMMFCLNRARKSVREMWEEEKGSTSTIVIEIVMVGMILVLGFVFRKAIAGLFTNLWNSLIKFDESASDPTIAPITNPFG